MSVSEEEFFESCLQEVLANLRTKGFNFALKSEQRRALRHLFKGRISIMAVFPTVFGKTLTVFQLLVLMLEVKSKRHGRAGYASIIVVSPRVKVSSMTRFWKLILWGWQPST